MNKKLTHLIFVLLVAFTINLNAQTEDSQWSVGLNFGKMEYDGTVGSNAVFKSPFNAHFGARVSKYLSPLFDVSLAGTYGKQGLNGLEGQPDLFEGNVIQANLHLLVKPVNVGNFTLFFSGGAGYFSYTDDSPAAVAMPGMDSNGIAIPVGAGFKYHVSDRFELMYHSQYSVSYSGDAYNGVDVDSKDKYWLHQFGIGMNFGMQDRDGDRVADDKDECPDEPGEKDLAGCPDSDMDGIADKDDACPQVAGLMEYNGCPDTDGDGVIDRDDLCPQVMGDAMYSGCPDTDGDGIGDGKDECVNEPGLERYNGCPIPDSDGDGFNDEDDECPNMKGDLRGCPDTDGDGFHDKEDNCVNTKGTAQGCPDRDSDGIADKDDNCPDVAGIPAKNGCPEIPIPTREEVINSWRSDNIQFISGTRPDENYDANIAQIVEFHNKYPDAYLHLGGYSDSTGSEADNMRVSERRAKKVYSALVAAGIPADQITYEGYGEANPVADNDTREGRLKNRRVEVSASTVKREIDRNVKR